MKEFFPGLARRSDRDGLLTPQSYFARPTGNVRHSRSTTAFFHYSSRWRDGDKPGQAAEREIVLPAHDGNHLQGAMSMIAIPVCDGFFESWAENTIRFPSRGPDGVACIQVTERHLPETRPIWLDDERAGKLLRIPPRRREREPSPVR